MFAELRKFMLTESDWARLETFQRILEVSYNILF